MDLGKIVNEDRSQFISNPLMTHDELPDLLTWLDPFVEMPCVHTNIYFLLRQNSESLADEKMEKSSLDNLSSPFSVQLADWS